jgi:hypothetical protein
MLSDYSDPHPIDTLAGNPTNTVVGIMADMMCEPQRTDKNKQAYVCYLSIAPGTNEFRPVLIFGPSLYITRVERWYRLINDTVS